MCPIKFRKQVDLVFIHHHLILYLYQHTCIVCCDTITFLLKYPMRSTLNKSESSAVGTRKPQKGTPGLPDMNFKESQLYYTGTFSE